MIVVKQEMGGERGLRRAAKGHRPGLESCSVTSIQKMSGPPAELSGALTVQFTLKKGKKPLIFLLFSSVIDLSTIPFSE